LTGDYSVEPRFGTKWQFADNHAFGFGYGRHSRHEVLSMYFYRVLEPDSSISIPNTKLDLTKSDHFAFSYENSKLKNLYFKAEVFYQRLSDVLVKIDSNNSTQAPVNNNFPVGEFRNQGAARNYGIELLLDKTLSNGYYLLGSVTLFDSKFNPHLKDNWPHLEDKWFHTRYNARYIQNLVGGKEFKLGKGKKDLLGVNCKVIWAGGYRGQSYYPDSTAIPHHKYEKLYKDYFRIDASISYRLNRPKTTHIISCDFQNVTFRDNIYRNELDRPSLYHLEIVLPIFNYRIEF
jgi:outer membrane receptor protein involved in Fe transport